MAGMPDAIFAHDRLTVYPDRLEAGSFTAFCPSISGTYVYEGRPFLVPAIAGFVSSVMLAGFLLWGRMLLGYSIWPIIVPCGVAVAAVAFAAAYRAKCLFVSIDGRTIAVLRSKDRSVLEQARRAIEQARLAHPVASRV